jgi:cell division protein FtsZ
VRIGLDDDEPKNTGKGSNHYYDLEDSNNAKKKETFNQQPKLIKENIEPFVKEGSKKKEEPKVLIKETLEERKQRLKNLSLKLDNPEIINELENQPAYLRKGLKLDDVEHSSEKNMSRWVLTDDEEPEIKDSNSYLHDNVD